ncbi:MAG: response regulator [Candidatus Xenobiia bacterium LiM19]
MAKSDPFGSFEEGATGKECLEIARREKSDIILLDVMLPDRDGTEVSAEIKSDPLWRRSTLF